MKQSVRHHRHALDRRSASTADRSAGMLEPAGAGPGAARDRRRRRPAGRERARSAPTPAGTPAARRTTSSWSSEPERPGRDRLGQGQPADRRAAHSTGSGPRRRAHARDRELFVQDLYAGADPAHRLSVRVITEPRGTPVRAQHVHSRRRRAELAELRARLHRAARAELQGRPGDRRHAHGRPSCSTSRPRTSPHRRHALRRRDQEVDLHRPELPAADAGRAPDALLGQRRAERRHRRCSSACPAPARPRCRPTPSARLIGDDEHGWSDDGVFNFEGGCYAKVINLSRRGRAGDLRAPTQMFGTMLENVVLDPTTGAVDFDDDSRSPRTRARRYPLHYIREPRAERARRAPEERRLPDRRRVRRAAADRAS